VSGLATISLDHYRERYYPYGSVGLAQRSMQPIDPRVELDGVPVDVQAQLGDIVDADLLDYEQRTLQRLSHLAALDLTDVDIRHVVIGAPNAITLCDLNDQSRAIGIDPGVHQALILMYFDAALGQQVQDPKWFLVLVTKTIGLFWTGQAAPSAEDLRYELHSIREHRPDVYEFGTDVLDTSLTFALAHEVGVESPIVV
jgi:hypothetical protein